MGRYEEGVAVCGDITDVTGAMHRSAQAQRGGGAHGVPHRLRMGTEHNIT